MQFRRLGRSGVAVSPICLGTMMFGGPTSPADSTKIMHAALDHGINFFDTANIYCAGESENVVGAAIADRRERVVLATKGRNAMGSGPNEAGAGRRHLRDALDASLKRLKTDYVDIYYVHTPDYETPIEETVRVLDDFIRAGKVNYVACSNFRAWRVMEALGVAKQLGLNSFQAVQPLYNICNRDAEVELFPLCKEHGIGVVSYSPLARGILSGKYKKGEQFPEGSRAARNDKRMQQAELRDESFDLAEALKAHCSETGRTLSQFALAWCLANPVVSSVIIGPRTWEQFEDNLGCLTLQISSEDETFVDSLNPPGEHTGKGYRDPLYPITGRTRL